MKISKGKFSILLIVVLLIIDQIIKVEVKTNLCLHESIRITDWFYINFIENSGMAYGMTFINKYVLSIFRIVAVSVIGYYIYKQVKANTSWIFLVCLSMIMAGAAGNIFDSVFYGQIFTASSPYYTAYMVPFGQGYAPLLMGKVVDMFYFPIIETTYPDWFPIWGGQPFVFFSPVFNFADACISVGVVLLLLFCRKEISNLSESGKKKNAETV